MELARAVRSASEVATTTRARRVRLNGAIMFLGYVGWACVTYIVFSSGIALRESSGVSPGTVVLACACVLVLFFWPFRLSPRFSPLIPLYVVALESFVFTLAAVLWALNDLSDVSPFGQAFLAVSSVIAPGFLVFLLVFLVANLIRRWVAQPPDPFPYLVLGLVDAVSLAGKAAEHDDQIAGVPSIGRRRELARKLEDGARFIESNSGPAAPVGGGIGPEASAAVAARWRRVAAWLRELEAEVMWPSREALPDVHEKLLAGLIGACSGNWVQLDAEPPAIRVGTRLQRNAGRISLAAVVFASAWLIPAILGTAISAAGATTLRVTLIITAVTALLTPQGALHDAATTVASIAKPRGG
jgi:hypothetical protein